MLTARHVMGVLQGALDPAMPVADLLMAIAQVAVALAGYFWRD